MRRLASSPFRSHALTWSCRTALFALPSLLEASEFVRYVRQQGRQLQRELYERQVHSAATLRSHAFDAHVRTQVHTLCAGLTHIRQADVEAEVVHKYGLCDERMQITCLVPYRIGANMILARLPPDIRAEALKELHAEECAVAQCIPPGLTALPTPLTTSSSSLRQPRREASVKGRPASNQPALPDNRWIQWYDADVYVFEGKRYLDRLRTYRAPRIPRIPLFALLGASGHGKTTLLDALHGRPNEKDINEDKAEVRRYTQTLRAFTFSKSAAKCQGGRDGSAKAADTTSAHALPSSLCVTVIDTPGQRSFVETRLHVHMIADCVILVVSVLEGLQSQTYEAIKVALNVDKPIIVVFTKMDLLSDAYTAQSAINRLMRDLDTAGLRVKLVGRSSELHPLRCHTHRKTIRTHISMSDRKQESDHVEATDTGATCVVSVDTLLSRRAPFAASSALDSDTDEHRTTLSNTRDRCDALSRFSGRASARGNTSCTKGEGATISNNADNHDSAEDEVESALDWTRKSAHSCDAEPSSCSGDRDTEKQTCRQASSSSSAAVYFMPMKHIDANYQGSVRHPRIHLHRRCLGVCVSARRRVGLPLLWEILSLYRDTAQPHCRSNTVCASSAVANAAVQAVVLESSKHLFDPDEFRSSARRQRLQRHIDAAQARREARYVRRTSVLTRAKTVMRVHAQHLRARNRTSTSCLTLTVIVREGVLTRGMYFVADQAYGCVEYMLDGWGRDVVERALPGTTVTIIDTHSASGCPFAGVHLLSMSDAAMQQRVYRYRQRLQWFVEVYTHRLDLLRPRGMNTLFTHLGDYGQVGVVDSLETQLVYGGKLPAPSPPQQSHTQQLDLNEVGSSNRTDSGGRTAMGLMQERRSSMSHAVATAAAAARVEDEEGGVCLGEYLAQLNHREELAEVEQLLLPTTSRLPPRLVSQVTSPSRSTQSGNSMTATTMLTDSGHSVACASGTNTNSAVTDLRRCVPTFLHSAQEAVVLETQWRSLQRLRPPATMDEYTRALSLCLQVGVLVKVDCWHMARMLTREVTRCGTSKVQFQVLGVRYGPLCIDDILYFANSVKIIVCLRTPQSGSSEMDTYMDLHDIWSLHTDCMGDVIAFLKWCAVTIQRERISECDEIDDNMSSSSSSSSSSMTVDQTCSDDDHEISIDAKDARHLEQGRKSETHGVVPTSSPSERWPSSCTDKLQEKNCGGSRHGTKSGSTLLRRRKKLLFVSRASDS